MMRNIPALFSAMAALALPSFTAEAGFRPFMVGNKWTYQIKKTDYSQSTPIETYLVTVEARSASANDGKAIVEFKIEEKKDTVKSYSMSLTEGYSAFHSGYSSGVSSSPNPPGNCNLTAWWADSGNWNPGRPRRFALEGRDYSLDTLSCKADFGISHSTYTTATVEYIDSTLGLIHKSGTSGGVLIQGSQVEIDLVEFNGMPIDSRAIVAGFSQALSIRRMGMRSTHYSRLLPAGEFRLFDRIFQINGKRIIPDGSIVPGSSVPFPGPWEYDRFGSPDRGYGTSP